MAASPEGLTYEVIASEIERALRFMAACGIDLGKESALHQVDFWTSHEALLLGWEEALTRQDSLTGDWYDCSAHLLWIGERTRHPDGAHVEFLSGDPQPGRGSSSGRRPRRRRSWRCAPASTRDRRPGRLVLISRMGAPLVRDALPPLVRAVRGAGHPVVWACDPMHGNTFTESERVQDPATSTTSWRRSGATSRCTGRRVRGPAGSTWS